MPAEIKLMNSASVALVDDEDVDLVSRYAWWEHQVSDKLSYAYGVLLPRQRPGERIIKMHRLIIPGAKILDHIDGNGLNNRRVNLQPVTTAQNGQKANFRPERNPNKRHSIYRGVSYLGWHGRYFAYINYNGKRIYLGYHATAEEAARVRDAKAKELHGKYARFNFEDHPAQGSVDNS